MSSPARRARAQPAFSVMSAVTPVRTKNDFVAALPRRPAPEELCVVSFVRQDCRACKYASAQFRRLAEDRAAESVRFFEMDVALRDTQGLSRDLGVTAVPSFHFYTFCDGDDAGVGCLDTVVGPTSVGKVRDRVDQFSAKDFDIGEYAFA